ncbi:MAG: hypothetical protein OXB97_03925, partial [Rhodospirillales bacterium]|nr:hypothetical protein [Rhodospirillales bacterium]
MMRSWGDDTVRGGQTVFHGLRMWGQLVRVGLLLTAFLTVAVPAVQYLRTVPGYHLYAAGMLTLAEAKLAMGYGEDAGQEIWLENGGRADSKVRNTMMRAWGGDPARGGQTVFHGLRMWGQLVRVGLLLTAFLTV